MRTKFYIPILLIVANLSISVAAQETKRFSGHGIDFEYLSSWHLSEKSSKDTDEVALSSSQLDAQITVIVIKTPLETKDIAEARKRVVDPWLDSLQKNYSTMAGTTLTRTNLKTEAGGQATDGVQFKFELDGQGGLVEAYWVSLDKKLVLVYMVRPDRTAESVLRNWDMIRRTIQLTGPQRK